MPAKKVIGILTWREGMRFAEPGYLRRLVAAGRKLGADVFLFSHQDVFARGRKIRGFVPKANGGWESGWHPWPQIVIDRYRRRVPAYMKLRHSGLFDFANSPFSKKWRVTQLLASDERVQQWIPATSVYSPERFKAMLKRYPILYVKPGNGTGGRGIAKVVARANGYEISGRDKRYGQRTASLRTAEQAGSWVKRWVRDESIQGGNFLVQQGLDLGLVPRRVTDVRLLIQKDGKGEWRVTGCGARVGKSGSATSNLHGGGKAVPFHVLVAKRFGEEQAGTILRECHQMAHQVARVLEERFGRMMEFGLDIGVDVDGKVWLIEVNPKPGREVFRQMGELALYEEAIRRPVQFALHLIEEKAKQNPSKDLSGERSVI
ncbi:YheC/YheD family protein [Brevibacillus brevis]|uniref:YheC/YheD family protein n=1 Tax=Brevibacillus brevis TaxID=1393 RepID=A0ABY9SZP8_BREBE|nr:YheC/YheD family protein [Brevibacillus brevis]WNC13285.1 YheC/YheD family protein [Brevibacillus brevis]